MIYFICVRFRKPTRLLIDTLLLLFLVVVLSLKDTRAITIIKIFAPLVHTVVAGRGVCCQGFGILYNLSLGYVLRKFIC